MHHTEALRRMQKHFGSPPGLLLWQIKWFAEHVDQTFDVAFYDRAPLLAVSLTKRFAREWCATLMYGRSQRLNTLVKKMAFSDGTVVDLSEIWTREIIGQSYRCKSPAEEDQFLSRWIAL